MEFVQWFEIMNGHTLYKDEIETALKCIRLRRKRTGGKVGHLSSSPKYGLVSADII